MHFNCVLVVLHTAMLLSLLTHVLSLLPDRVGNLISTLYYLLIFPQQAKLRGELPALVAPPLVFKPSMRSHQRKWEENNTGSNHKGPQMPCGIPPCIEPRMHQTAFSTEHKQPRAQRPAQPDAVHAA